MIGGDGGVIVRREVRPFFGEAEGVAAGVVYVRVTTSTTVVVVVVVISVTRALGGSFTRARTLSVGAATVLFCVKTHL